MKKAYISRRANRELVKYLASQDYEINTVTEYGIVNQHTTDIDEALGLLHMGDGTFAGTKKIHVDPRIATHPDIYMCQLGLWREAGMFFGDPEKLGPAYPDDIIYNAVCTRDFVFHLVEKTDPDLVDAVVTWRRSLAQATGRPDETGTVREETKILGVRQGYTRCMCLPVDNRSFITSDRGLAAPLEAQGADVLLIEKGHILLSGHDHGFIGGCAGNIFVKAGKGKEQRAIIFHGDLSVHPDFNKITDFIKSRNILPVWFDDFALEDIGSILAIE